MNPRPEPARLPREPDPLTAWTHATLRSLPPPSAPATLAGRVLAELARRERLPWWRRDFASWPRWARLAFVTVAAGGAALIIAVLIGGAGRLVAAFAQFESLLAPLGAVARSLVDWGGALPAVWLQGFGIAWVTSLAVLISLAAALARLLAPRT